MQGPRSRELLQSLTSADMSNEAFPFRTARDIDIGFARVLCVRITYLGELGYELYVPAEQAVARVRPRSSRPAQAFGLRHAGLKALASLRMEKGYRDYGHDIDNTDSVLEAGLGFAVDLDKPGGFIGRDAVVAKQGRRAADASPRAGAGRRPGAADVPRRGRCAATIVPVGYVRAASYGFTLGGAVGLAMIEAGEPVDAEYLSSGRWEVEIAGRELPGSGVDATALRSRQPADQGVFVKRGHVRGTVRRARQRRVRSGADRSRCSTPATRRVFRPRFSRRKRGRRRRRRTVGQGARLEGCRTLGWPRLGGWSVRDDALLIDLAGLREMTVDVDNLTATASPSVRGGQELGAVPASARPGVPRRALFDGRPRRVPVARWPGLELAAWGWGCENVLGSTWSLPMANWCTPTPRKQRSLLGCPRCRPGFFGIVTRFHLRVHRMPAAFTHTTYAFPIECFDELMPGPTTCCPRSTSGSSR